MNHMNKSTKMGFAAIVLFAISHFLPAFGGYRGYACFQECWKTMTKHDMTDVAGWLYYSGFVFSSVTFVVLAGALFLTRKARFFRLCASVIILLHTISWLLVNVKGLSNVEVGYYVWLTAYALLFTVHLTKESNKSVETNRRPASPFNAKRQFGRASCDPPSLSAAVAHLWRWP
jgi:hypothetical protein